MKRMVTYLVTLGMLLSMVPTSVTAADATTASIVAADTTGFQEVQDPPASSISVASLSGKWADADTLEELEIRTIKNDTKITSAELVAVERENVDGYLFMLNAEGNYAYWSADFTMISAGEEVKFTATSQKLSETNMFVTSGSAVTAMSAIVTPYDSAGRAADPITVTWDKNRVVNIDNVRFVKHTSNEFELYKGEFTFTGKDGKVINGTIKFEYTLNSDNSKSYWYTFYDNNGSLWNAFAATGEIPFNTLAGQTGNHSFMHYLFTGEVTLESETLNLRSQPTTASYSEVIGNIPNKTKLYIFNSGVNGWYKTKYNGKIGYVSADFIKQIQEETPSNSETVNIEELVGRWRYDVADDKYTVDVCAKYNGVIDIKKSGSFMMMPTSGSVMTGKVTIGEETYSNGTKVPVISFNNGNNVAFGGYYNKDSETITIGNGGMGRLVKDNYWNDGTEKTAIEKMDNYSKIDAILACCLPSDNEVAFTENNIQFRKVSETSAYTSLADIKALINDTTTGDLNKKLLEECDRVFVEKDGVLYEANGGRGSLDIMTGRGVMISDKTDKSFTAITVGANEMIGQGHGKAEFVADGDTWKISGFEMDYFKSNISYEDYKECANRRANQLVNALGYISAAGDADSKDKIKVDGVEYAKTKEEYVTPDYLKAIVNGSCTGDIKESLIKSIDSRYVVKDGVTYVSTEPGQNPPAFDLANGVRILELTDAGFKAITANYSDKDGFGIFELVPGTDRFLIKEYTSKTIEGERLFRGKVTVNSGDLNFREKPNTSSTILAEIPNGTELSIYSSGTTGWYKAGYNGYEGYVSADYIEELPEIVTTTTTTTSTTTTTTTTTASTTSVTTTAAPEKDDATAALEKMKDLNLIWAVFGTSSSTKTEDGYSKAASESVKSVADLKALIERTCTGELKENFLAEVAEKAVDKDGALYIKVQPSAFYQFKLDKGVSVKTASDGSITATAKDGDQLYGVGRVVIVKADGKQYIKSFEFGEFETSTKGDLNNDGAINLKDVTVLRRYVAGGWGVTVDENAADVNGDGSVNLKDVTVLRRYVAGGWGITLK